MYIIRKSATNRVENGETTRSDRRVKILETRQQSAPCNAIVKTVCRKTSRRVRGYTPSLRAYFFDPTTLMDTVFREKTTRIFFWSYVFKAKREHQYYRSHTHTPAREKYFSGLNVYILSVSNRFNSSGEILLPARSYDCSAGSRLTPSFTRCKRSNGGRAIKTVFDLNFMCVRTFKNTVLVFSVHARRVIRTLVCSVYDGNGI